MTSRAPGGAVLSWASFGSAALLVVNDLVLKRRAPGLLSGKLSDVALCVFLPLWLAAAAEVVHALVGAWRGRRDAWRTDGRVRDLAACAVALAYFVLVKTVPWATHAHVAWLSALAPGHGMRAVTDPTDLVCLPAALVALQALARRRAALSPSRGRTRPSPPAWRSGTRSAW